MKKRAIALTLILLTGCTSSFNSKIVKALHETTDPEASARWEALFYKLYPGDTAKDKAAAICAAVKSGTSDEVFASNNIEESRSLVSSGKITKEQLVDATVVNSMLMVEAKKDCK